jgi:cytochrome P450
MTDSLAALLARKTRSLRMHVRTLLGRGALPNAIIIGAMKSGTTSLFDYLVQHPDVCGSRTKELHYFDTHFAKGERWYRANFTPRGESVRLESSPYYFFHPLAPARAAKLVPDAKLILLLRNPVDRAYSHHNQNVEEGLEPLPFEEALDQEEERLAGAEDALASGHLAVSQAHQTFSYIAKGLYARQLRNWRACFPEEQLLILKAEDFFRAPQDGVDRVTDFLGLSRFSIADQTPGNQRRYPLMHPEARQRLEARFVEPNEELRRLTGISWLLRPHAAPLSPAEIDLESAHLLREPWPGYEAVRVHGPVVWLPRQRFWLVVGHHAVREAFERSDLFSNAPYRKVDPILAGADPPAHARARELAARVFANGGRERACLAAIRAAGANPSPGLEAAADFATPIARAVTGALLGITAEEAWDALPTAVPHGAAYRDWLKTGLTPEESASLSRLIWLAGTVTLEAVIAWAVYELVNAPTLQTELRDAPMLLPAFVEEVLRLHPPNHMSARQTTRDTSLSGTVIPAGAPVQLCLSAANRDPAIFTEPDRLDLRRERRPHLSFGAGPHHCLGASLAREIGPAVLSVLLERRLVGAGQIQFSASVDSLSPSFLPIRLEPAHSPSAGTSPPRGS